MALTKATNRMITGASVNVKDYGAVGDGVTDDTVAIQAAIDAVKAEGGTVTVPPGIYIVGTTVSNYLNLDGFSDITILGTGGTIKMANNTLLLNSKSILNIINSSNITISNLIMDGNNQNNTDNTGGTVGLVGLINVQESSYVTVSDCLLKHCNNVAVYFATNAIQSMAVNNISVDCFGTDFKVGTTADAIINGNIVDYTRDVHAGKSKQDGCIAVQYNGSAEITNNKITIGTAVTLPPNNYVWVTQANTLKVSDNVCKGTVGLCVNAQALAGNCTSIIIESNYFEKGAIEIVGTAAVNIDTILINDNVFKAGSVDVSTNITVDSLLINDNIIENPSSYAIRSTGNPSCTISGNSIIQAAANHGIFVTGDRVKVSDNTIDLAGTANRGIECYSSYSTITGNIIYNGTSYGIKEVTADFNVFTSNIGQTVTLATVLTVGANTISANNIG